MVDDAGGRASEGFGELGQLGSVQGCRGSVRDVRAREAATGIEAVTAIANPPEINDDSSHPRVSNPVTVATTKSSEGG